MNLVCLNSTHPDFIGLTHALDVELKARYGTMQSTYDKHNVMDPIATAIVGYVEDKPAACGCFKPIDEQTIEIKRMYVAEALRRRGFALLVLQALELWGTMLGYRHAILETGRGQPEAIHLYEKCGYEIIANYGPYIELENSICMRKAISPNSDRKANDE